MRVLAHVYPGWHPIPERDLAFYPGFTEWDLLEACRPRFQGHAQPRRPLWGRYDDRDPKAVGRRVQLAGESGIDGFVYGFFWCRGKRVFQDALDLVFLASLPGKRFPFAVMWANRMPRRVLPVRRADVPVLEAGRWVSSDVPDFTDLVLTLAKRYFTRENYIRVRGRALFSIYDTTFFLRELGIDGASEAIARARSAIAERGLPDFHLLAIDPQPETIAQLRSTGFDGVTHYVLLPDWKGPPLQDYSERAELSSKLWPTFTEHSGLPYHPSVSPGWDASPRGADFGERRPDKYPWSPVVTGEHPHHFADALLRARRFVEQSDAHAAERLLFIASFNEWTEGHYLEPDERFGMGWLEAVQRARGAG